MTIQEAIQMLAGTYKKDFVSILIATIESVDEDAYTCVCKSISGDAEVEIPDIKLNAESNDGWCIVPAVGSIVMIASSTRNNYYILMYSDIAKIICIIDNSNSFVFDSNGFVWNDGTLGGMTKTLTLLTKINVLEAKINQLLVAVAAINTAGTGSPGTPVTNGALMTFFASLNPTTPIILTTQPELEDTKIKH